VPTSSPTQTLFQVAVALIPVLLFGGALVGRGTEAERRRRDESSAARGPVGRRFVAAGIIAVILFATAAELVAINGTFDVSPSDFEIRFVVLALTVGTLAVGFNTGLSWLHQLVPGPRERHRMYVVTVVVALGIAVGAQFVVTDTIDGASAIGTLNAADASVSSSANQLQTAQAAADTAHTTLVALLGSSAFRGLPEPGRAKLFSTTNEFATDLAGAAESNRSSLFTTIANDNGRHLFLLISSEHSDPTLTQRLSDVLTSFITAEGALQAATLNEEQASRNEQRACRAAAPYNGCVTRTG
jgi:hypothetical protein